ncbi:MAG: carbamoyltransferase [Planctomycetaceae bacterium]
MTAILGISGLYHDSAAALVVDGQIIAAAQEERFTRTKHDPAMPENAIRYCLSEAGLTVADLDYVGFYDKPLLTFERLLETWVSFAPTGFSSFISALPIWIKQKLHIPREIKKSLNGEYKRRIVFTNHHESHAASAFFPSPYDEAAILTVDGVGEWATATTGIGRGNKIELQNELRFPHSLGLLYTAFTYYCGFKVNSGEYKLMGLAPYGEPKYADTILEHLLDLKDDGSFRMDMSYFNYHTGRTMTSGKFDKLFGSPPRKPESDLQQRHMDLAASVQKVTEEILLRMANHLHATTGMKHLVMAGGVALNCVANGCILRETPFEDIWIQPAAGDAGGALGVAQFIWHQLLDKPRTAIKPDGQSASYLGPAAKPQHVETFLKAQDAVFTKFEDFDELCRYVADLLATENVVGWMQGRMEFGPRALGARSILGDARSTKMQSIMNLKIKFRESFRPFAPSILHNRASEYFEIDPEHNSPYMLLVADVHADKRTNVDESQAQVQGLDKLNVVRSTVPAITHVDNSARVQTVDPERHERYYKLLKAFESKTDSPVLINTSFNVRGEPIVSTPGDAWNCFMSTNMDVLVIENYVMLKKDQPNAIEHDPTEYLSKFKLD